MLIDLKIVVDDQINSIKRGKTIKYGRKNDIFQTNFPRGDHDQINIEKMDSLRGN